MEHLLEVLQAGGDVGIWVLIFVVWQFERRLVKVETQIAFALSQLKRV